MNLEQIRPAWVEVDLDAFENNLQMVQKLVGPRCAQMAIVKANAYGHGAIECARIAEEVGCKMVGVAVLDEALELRRAGVRLPVLVLGYTPPGQADLAVKNDIEITVYNADTARAMSISARKLGRLAKVHIKIETGMGRLGVEPGPQLQSLLAQIASLSNLSVSGVFTHFSVSDEDAAYTKQQFSRYSEALSQIPPENLRSMFRHTANSAAILDFPETYLDMVRPGIILYGYYPSDSVSRSAKFVPMLSLKARIGHIRHAGSGETIGYGRTCTASRPTLVATLPLGYADGYNRAFSNRGYALVRGQAAPILGRVCMDQMMVDVTDISDAHIGDEVVLIGKQGERRIDAEDLATDLDTIVHEVLTRLGSRLPRVYRRCGSLYTLDPVTSERVDLAQIV